MKGGFCIFATIKKLVVEMNTHLYIEQAPSLVERAGGEAIIDVSHLSAGMYFLKIDGKVGRFVKE